MPAVVAPIKARVAARKIVEIALERGRERTAVLTEGGGGLAPRVVSNGTERGGVEGARSFMRDEARNYEFAVAVGACVEINQ